MSAVLTEDECQQLFRAADLMLRLAAFDSDVAMVEA
jgi:hypothetical protein